MPDPETKTELTPLGLEIQLSADEVEARGRYDASRTPEPIKRLVCFLLAVPGMKWDQIAKTAGIAWETVAAISRHRPDAIREFKGRLAGNLALIIEAATPGLLEKATQGKVTPFELKLLTETWALLAGEATSRHEIVSSSPELDDIRRLLATRNVAEMGRDAGENLASGAPGLGAGQLAGSVPGPVIDAELVVDSHQSKV